MRGRHLSFTGRIAGVGTTSGVRVVVGRWEDSPLGAFADAMVEDAAGHRLLLAPTEAVADLVATTYRFDEVRVVDVDVAAGVGATGGPGTWTVAAGPLALRLDVGGRTPLGWALRAVPAPLARDPRWTLVTDPVARLVLRGVRTRGSAGSGRREYYAATDLHAVTSASGRLGGLPLGDLAPVHPPPRFGFGSTPSRPGVTTLTTTVVLPGGGPPGPRTSGAARRRP